MRGWSLDTWWKKAIYVWGWIGIVLFLLNVLFGIALLTLAFGGAFT